MSTSSGSRDELDAGRAPEVVRADLQRAFLPDGTDRLQTERAGRSAAPEVGNAVAVDWGRVGAAAGRVDRGYICGAVWAQKWGVIRSGLGGC